MSKVNRLAILMLVALAATAQAPQITQVPAQMLRWLVPSAMPPGAPFVVMVTPNGSVSMVALGKGLALDTSNGGTPVLIATTVVPPPVVLHPAEKTVVVRCDAETLVFAIPDATFDPASLAVYRNGLLMASPDDYATPAQNVVFVAAQAPQTGDIVQLRYHLIPK